MNAPLANPTVFDLAPAEKLQLVLDLWDDLAADPHNVPVNEWQIAEAERRKANLQRNPGSGLSWEQITERIRRQYGN